MNAQESWARRERKNLTGVRYRDCIKRNIITNSKSALHKQNREYTYVRTAERYLIHAFRSSAHEIGEEKDVFVDVIDYEKER